MKESFSDRVLQNIIVVLLVLFSILMIIPLYYIIVVSLTDSTYYIQKAGKVFFPAHFSLDAYKYLFSTDVIIRALGVSLFLAVVGTAMSLMVNAGISYAVSRKRLRGRKLLLMGILITMIFNPGMVPPFLLIRSLKLMDSIWALILPALTSGWYVILMRGFFDSIPESLEEAALIDGCNDITIFFKIVLPLSMPSIAAFSLFYAVGYWNTYFSAVIYINNPALWPMQVIVRNLIDVSSAVASGEAAAEMKADMPSEVLKMASVVIAVVPILAVYPFLQKHFTKGAMLGSIKE